MNAPAMIPRREQRWARLRKRSTFRLPAIGVAIGLLAPSAARAGCESMLEARGPGFTYTFSDMDPFVEPDSTKSAATLDSLRAYYRWAHHQRLFKALRAAACASKRIASDTLLARTLVARPIDLWESPRHSLRQLADFTRANVSDAYPDSILRRVAGPPADTTAIVYCVSLGVFASPGRAESFAASLETIPQPSHDDEPDPDLEVDWWNSTCSGTHRPSVYVVGPAIVGMERRQVLYGLFLDASDARRMRERVSPIVPEARVVPMPLTFALFDAALRSGLRRTRNLR